LNQFRMEFSCLDLSAALGRKKRGRAGELDEKCASWGGHV
jgi:hypothetical protein